MLFGLTFEVEGLEQAGPGPVIVLIRHASIIDNALPDAVIGHAHGLGLRFVLKRELQMIPTIDIGGRWVPTNFVRRASTDPAAEVALLRGLADDLGEGEGVLIYPEGTRHTDAKLARAQEVIAERQPGDRAAGQPAAERAAAAAGRAARAARREPRGATWWCAATSASTASSTSATSGPAAWSARP